MPKQNKAKMKVIDIKGKGYIEVNERIKYFRENYPNHSLTSEWLRLDDNMVICKAFVKDETGRILADGTAYEMKGSTFINKTSYIENCETSAWGRALGNFGIGIDTAIASADEVLNAIKNQNTQSQQPQKITPEQYKKIQDIVKNKNIDVPIVLEELAKTYNVKKSQQLSYEQAVKFIEWLNKYEV